MARHVCVVGCDKSLEEVQFPMYFLPASRGQNGSWEDFDLFPLVLDIWQVSWVAFEWVGACSGYIGFSNVAQTLSVTRGQVFGYGDLDYGFFDKP